MSESLTSESAQTPEQLSLQALADLGIVIDPGERAAQLENITGEGIAVMLDRVHRIVAPEVSHEPYPAAMKMAHPVTGEVSAVLAEPTERADIFEHAAQKVRELGMQRSSDDDNQSFLNRAGDTIALAIVLAHAYEDGNGRSARTMAQLVRSGLDMGDEESVNDMLVVSANRPASGQGGFRVNGYLPQWNMREDKTPQEFIDRMARTDIPFQQTELYLAERQKEFTTPFTN